MIVAIESLIRDYGVLAVLAGCMAEGESAAIVGGFFAHQRLLPLAPTYSAALVGTFIGDTIFYVIGKRFADHPWVLKMRTKPGFSHAMRLANAYPKSFVFFNRYAYGMRVLGGVTCGLAKIGWPVFILFNILSSIAWATLFVGIGWFFGMGVEALLGDILRKHERVFIGIGIVLVCALIALLIGKRVVKHEHAAERQGRS